MLKKSILLLIIIVFNWVNFNDLTLANNLKSFDDSSIKPYLNEVKKNITEFTLSNNIKFIVLENHQAPIISFVTYVDVGGVNEPEGKTGVAHFLEHLAFKGTEKIGTYNYNQESQILDQLDNLFDKIKEAKVTNNEETLNQLETEFDTLNQQAQKLVKQNEFGQIVELMGGVGLNAATSADATVYFYNFPANKLELWMYLESERFLNPVFREFEQEKQVILEERKLRTDNSPIGKMIEAFLDTAFSTHPYKRPVIGYEEDIINLSRDDVKNFYEEYYGGSNLTIAIVGDVNPSQVKEMATKYFGRFPTSNKPSQLTVKELLQNESKKITISYPSQPLYLEGYHIPDVNHPDYLVYDMIASILSNGRTSRLYQSLVEKEKIALGVSGFNGFPGDKYPNLMIFYASLAPDKKISDLQIALHGEIEKLKTDFVTDEELNRVKTQAKASLILSLGSNGGMARLLTEYQAKTGDWRNLFLSLDQISNITPRDIQRVAIATFTENNQTVAELVNNE